MYATMEDDRGRSVTIQPELSRENFADASRYERLAKELRGYRWDRRSNWVFVPFVAMALVPIVSSATTAMQKMMALGVVIVAFAALLAGVQRNGVRRSAGRTLMQARLSTFRDVGACMGCGQNMRGKPVDTDGCTICPSCGAAWRLWERENRGQRV